MLFMINETSIMITDKNIYDIDPKTANLRQYIFFALTFKRIHVDEHSQ